MNYGRWCRLLGVLITLFMATPVAAGPVQPDPTPASATKSLSSDPFADLGARPETASGGELVAESRTGRTRERRTRSFLKQELLEQISWNDAGAGPYRRLSYGGELLQRFSDAVTTWGSFNAQLRFVHRAGFLPVQNDVEGEERENGFLEYHNLYFDRFNALDAFLSPEARARHIGRFNFRLGRFYLPSGINLQTDTHGTVLQLSNERNFGFERDWYAGFWGALTKDLNYDLYAMAGSGYDLRLEGQKGLLGLRISLANSWLFEKGWEGGISLVTGERISKHALMRSPSVAALADRGKFIETRRLGLDMRHSRPAANGTVTMTAEWTAGRDEDDDVLTQLYQAEYLRRDRKLGYAVQYRRFRQAIGPGPMPMMAGQGPGDADASLIGEVTWYFRNEIGNANLHWIKLNIERQTERQMGRNDLLTTIQYYRYW
ncbi:MAG TPA: hypothetical protein PLP29_03515 [Candidatus Ozemobacteraceae bacterium]|nr:hypothetical protein [Candidatus Ozemobacteraceae bacterium]